MPKQPPIPETNDERYGLVYFLSHGTMGPIKIGFTADRDPNARLRQLQIGSPEPLTLVGIVEAHASVERAIQELLQPHLVRGEWFEREPAMLVFERLRMRSTTNSDFLRDLAFLWITRTHSERNDDDTPEALSVRVARDLIDDWIDQLRNVNVDMSLPFRAWLNAQTERNDPTGDLAHDATRDSSFPPMGSLVEYLEYIVERRSSPAVTRALLDAWIEFDGAVASLRFRKQDVWRWEN